MATTIEVRKLSDAAAVLAIKGEITAASEGALTDAYTKASAERVKTIMLDFTGLEYMNSSGIGLLVTMLVRANRAKQRLMAFGLNEHYRQIFSLTRLDEAIGIHGDEKAALAAAGAA